MSTSYPIQIHANPAMRVNMSTHSHTPSYTTGYIQGIEKALQDIIEKRTGELLADKSAELAIDDITNLEILMDLEEQVVGLHKAEPNELDAEFKKCKTFNDMMKCVRKYLR